MDTFISVIHPFFEQKKWRCTEKQNSFCYQKASNEFSITLFKNELEITVPLSEVLYKQKFNNPNVAAEYVKMHLARF